LAFDALKQGVAKMQELALERVNTGAGFRGGGGVSPRRGQPMGGGSAPRLTLFTNGRLEWFAAEVGKAHMRNVGVGWNGTSEFTSVEPGDYKAELRVHAAGAVDSPLVVPVTLSVTK
jgi:hypothetical protein